MTPSKHFFAVALIYAAGAWFQGCTPAPETPSWPGVHRETKPWTRWWWHGNALTKEGITIEMEAYQKAGLGGLEITPIYGVQGYESKFINYLSAEWMELFLHTLKEAERLDLGIDMATGTGWPFGGPWVSGEDACKDINYRIYELAGGNELQEKIEFTQTPFLRAVGNQLYEVNDTFSATLKSAPTGTRQEPLLRVAQKIDIKDLVDPVNANKNLQALALDQVKFEKPLPLKLLMGYNDNGETVNLTDKVDRHGKLNWVAPAGRWKLYALFEGWHGKMVERAGPGGEGNVIDHFSSPALQHYLQKFDSAFRGKDIGSLRSFFNDSYEVDDARGVASWTPLLLEEFTRRRGYNLHDHLPALFGHDNEQKNKRVLCDYRETISELLLENFTAPWRDWAHHHQALVRNQAHGSPANILDLYATVDIPEIEGVEPLRTKMASSAAHVTGKKLVSSESATWLNEHFESNLADIKGAVDQFLLNGVNHIFYHGTAYSPPNEPWPGWLFYAAVHLNPRNPLWRDFDALNTYIARSQSLLQNSMPDNDVLIYYPVYDRFSAPGKELIEHFDGIGRQFANTAFFNAANEMLTKGYSFDYISDRQIQQIDFEGERLTTEGKTPYQTLVLPHCEFIPLATMKKIIALADDGATIVVVGGFPTAVSGYHPSEENQKAYDELIKNLGTGTEIAQGIRKIKWGNGNIYAGANVDPVLTAAGIARETLVDHQLSFIRKAREGRPLYFVKNETSETVNRVVTLTKRGKTAVVYEPMTGKIGKAKATTNEKGVTVELNLSAGQSLFIEIYPDDLKAEPFDRESGGTLVPLTGKWRVEFTEGGPELPAAVEVDSLSSWTTFGDESYAAFSGTASYHFRFPKPAQDVRNWVLDLGSVKESARVLLNGRELGTLIGPTYEIDIDPDLLAEENKLEIQVSNGMANRIADLDRKGVPWKKFYNINFPARKPENRKDGLFDAAHWKPREAGLLRPVVLRAVK